ncbi:hypothetical protein AcW1_004090 [Taiwanofungus camphoratus]|nr:hypothetical protein AcW1_004090 [Antrodia cinnamomea]
MSTTRIDTPPDILQIVLNIQGEEVGRLRRQLQAAEAELNIAQERQASLVIELAEAQEFIRQLQNPALRGLPKLDLLPENVVPFCSTRSPRKYLKAVKSMFKRLSVIVLRDEFLWESCPATCYSIKPTRRRAKKGQWMDCRNMKLLRPRSELVACFSGRWCYLGTYTTNGSKKVTREMFSSLPPKTQQAVIALSGHKSHHNQLRSMYEQGELTAMKFHFNRVGFNPEYQKSLLDAVRNETRVLEQTPGESGATIILEVDSDSSDFPD